ncbi:MAG: hypothetical protein LBC69_02780 [Eubacteriaceae bacterium]|jgi:hypothetical protein|nr:hypothetical protein [Eubacteriaceae bacterium]
MKYIKLLSILLSFCLILPYPAYAAQGSILNIAPPGGTLGKGQSYTFVAQILTAAGTVLQPAEGLYWSVQSLHSEGTSFKDDGAAGELTIAKDEENAYVDIQASAKTADGEALASTVRIYIRENQPPQKEPLIVGSPELTLDNESSSALRLRIKQPTGADGSDVYVCLAGDSEFKLVASMGAMDPAKILYGFECGKFYYFKCVPFVYENGVKETGAHSEVVSAKVRPANPFALKAVGGDRSVRLSWEPVDDCDGYAIYRSSSKGGAYSLIRAIVGKNAKMYVDAATESGAAYYYKIVSYKKAGEIKVPSAFSGPAAATAK